MRFRRTALFLVPVAALALATASAQNRSRKNKSATPEITNPDMQFSGEIDRGKTYIHDIGHDLQFRLEVASVGDYAGWDICITPKVQRTNDDPIEFSGVATPPYHSFNDRYLNTTYNFSAKEILEMSPRRFNFVLTEDDEHRAEEAVNIALYPNSVSDDEKQRVAESAANIQLGAGEFSVVRFRITSLKDPLYPGSIEWIKFDVKLKFPPALTMSEVLGPTEPSSK